MEGNLCFKIDWKEIDHFCFILVCIWEQFPSTSPRGGYIRRGDLTEGFLLYESGGLIFGILRYICYSPAGRSVLGETVETEGTVSPNTDRPRPVNNIFIFFLLRSKSFRKIFLHSPTCVFWSRTLSCRWGARSISNQNKTLQHDF